MQNHEQDGAAKVLDLQRAEAHLSWERPEAVFDNIHAARSSVSGGDDGMEMMS